MHTHESRAFAPRSAEAAVISEAIVHVSKGPAACNCGHEPQPARGRVLHGARYAEAAAEQKEAGRELAQQVAHPDFSRVMWEQVWEAAGICNAAQGGRSSAAAFAGTGEGIARRSKPDCTNEPSSNPTS